MSDDTQQRVLEAAGRVFAERGYRDATVREICAAADVNLAAVNYYFGDKHRLYIEAVNRAHRLQAEQVPLPSWPVEMPPSERLRGFIRTLLDRMLGEGEEGSGWPAQLMLREIIEPTEACRELVEQYFRPHFEIMMHILRDILPEDTPAHVLHQLGFSIVGQILYYHVAGDIVSMMIAPEERDAHYARAQLADHISRVSLAAVGCVEPFGKSVDSPVSSSRDEPDTQSPSTAGKSTDRE